MLRPTLQRDPSPAVVDGHCDKENRTHPQTACWKPSTNTRNANEQRAYVGLADAGAAMDLDQRGRVSIDCSTYA